MILDQKSGWVGFHPLMPVCGGGGFGVVICVTLIKPRLRLGKLVTHRFDLWPMGEEREHVPDPEEHDASADE